MNKEIEEMNECEKTKLLAISKQGIKEEFAHINKVDWDKYFQWIKDKELLSAIAILLDAKTVSYTHLTLPTKLEV